MTGFHTAGFVHVVSLLLTGVRPAGSEVGTLQTYALTSSSNPLIAKKSGLSSAHVPGVVLAA